MHESIATLTFFNIPERLSVYIAPILKTSLAMFSFSLSLLPLENCSFDNVITHRKDFISTEFKRGGVDLLELRG